MSNKKLKNQAKRWLITAIDDFETAVILKDNKKYAQSCFYFQQSAEKAIKSLFFLFDYESWGHSIKRLLDELKVINHNLFNKFDKIYNKCIKLDRFYIPTRYPDGLPDITPSEAFDNDDSLFAMEITEKIINIVREEFDIN